MFNVYGRLLLVLAVLPGLLLLIYVYRQDKVEKEPLKLVVKLLIFGALSTILALILEELGSLILNLLPLYATGVPYNLLMYFIVVGCSEEGAKYLFLKKISWNNPAFDYVFDAIVYAVCVGIGFAVLENIEYAFSYGMTTVLIRAVTAIPAHTTFAIFMGHHYGLAKQCSVWGDRAGEKRHLRLAFLIPVLIHGFYDFTASSDSDLMMVIFLIFVVFMDIRAYLSVRKFAREDRPLA